MTAVRSPRVFGVGTSRTMRVHWMLSELGVEYETRKIIPRTDSMRDSEFLGVSGRGKVPILEHGDLVIGESGAIVFYLADHYRDRAVLAPAASTRERARFDERCFFILTELDAPLYIIRRHQGLPEVYGASQVAVDAARAYFLRQVGVVESWLEATGPYLAGTGFSAADLLLVTCSTWAQVLGIELSPALVAHTRSATARAAFKRAFVQNFPPEAMGALAKQRSDP